MMYMKRCKRKFNEQVITLDRANLLARISNKPTSEVSLYVTADETNRGGIALGTSKVHVQFCCKEDLLMPSETVHVRISDLSDLYAMAAFAGDKLTISIEE